MAMRPITVRYNTIICIVIVSYRTDVNIYIMRILLSEINV